MCCASFQWCISTVRVLQVTLQAFIHLTHMCTCTHTEKHLIYDEDVPLVEFMCLVFTRMSNFYIPSFFSCSPQSLQIWNDLCDALYQTFTCDWMNFAAPWYDLHCSLRITFQVTDLQRVVGLLFFFQSSSSLPPPPPHPPFCSFLFICNFCTVQIWLILPQTVVLQEFCVPWNPHDSIRARRFD